eukprot:8018181-Alexandrium_andersonii.AAC.1
MPRIAEARQGVRAEAALAAKKGLSDFGINRWSSKWRHSAGTHMDDRACPRCCHDALRCTA